MADWLLDNYYVIESVLRQIRSHLPRSYYRELPAIARGSDAGLPRIFSLATTLLAQTEGAISEPQLRADVKAFQQIATLTIGEVWAIPTMLRLATVEAIRNLADDILKTRHEMVQAESDLAMVRAGRRTQLPATATDAYRLYFWDALKTHSIAADAEADVVHDWVKVHLADVNEVAHREHTRQAGEQLAIGNAVTNLRVLDVIDWMAFFEAVSGVEEVLRTDPNGVYATQDFATRDRCRRAVEELAKGSRRAELDVARLAVAMATQHREYPVSGHVASVLLGESREAFEQQLGYRPTWSAVRQTVAVRHPHLVYFGSLAVFTLALLVATLLFSPLPAWWAPLVILPLALSPCLDLAVAFTQIVARQFAPPRVLPKLDWKGDIPDDCATFLVVPTLISRPAQAAGLIERLELHYLSNPDGALRYALLTDFTDAAQETMPDDEACVTALTTGIAKLNQQYATPESPRFFVFHRCRQFNPTEGCWMGWERKRGKLEEFNHLLRGAAETSYTTKFPATEGLPRMRFILTLDTDTVLPRDAAKHMIATLAHPLNRARKSADGRRVEAGYAVLQPRVNFLYQTGFRSWFARLFAGSAGVDPYSTACSDTYMDLFARGSFTGKGLYDIDAFADTAGEAFPDNRILSHDLIESNYARCALATDIEVYDEFPARYHAYARRDHRWIRGDWQLLPWLGKRVPTPREPLPNVLPALERWKIVDNLRRSLLAPALILLLVAGWTILPGSAWGWTLLALAPLAFPTLAMVLGGCTTILKGRTPRRVWAQLRFDLGNTAGQGLLRIVFLLNEAVHAVDAIARTLYRLLISRRHLLEWESAAATDRRLGDDFRSFATAMRTNSVLALGLTALVAWFAPWSLIAAAPLLASWLLAPFVAYRVSQPRAVREILLTDADRHELERVARRTWDFFETFVNDDGNWLPPDNYQESPLGVVAHRTSPTNIGLYLLAVQAANDFGYITPGAMCDRLEKAFDSLDRLERNHGHFLNWYDTSKLTTLLPAYVSTVDSGNLLACLLALVHGLNEDDTRTSNPAQIGLDHTLGVLLDELDREGYKASPKDSLAAAVQGGDRTAILKAVEGLKASIVTESESNRWLNLLVRQVQQKHATTNGEPLHARLAALAARARRYADEMDFRFLFNADRELFTIGYNATANRFDANYYDLLASEACIASFLAVARGEVARKHWFRLGRLATRAAGSTGLVSWGGTMFEYLMPRLLLPIPPGVLLDKAQRTAVKRQIEYGKEIHLPWGISESGFAVVDAGQVYQYQSFGVPGLGLKRGLDRDRVIAPYATLLAVDVDPVEAVKNLRHLRSLGGEGRYGFYEAMDFTPDRSEGTAPNVVKSYMAHHQGMGFLAIANRLRGGVFRRRLRAEPAVKAAELLLEERVPTDAPLLEPLGPPENSTGPAALISSASKRRITTPDTPTPKTHILSNGHYSVMVTNAGAGFSAWNAYSVTRWRPDGTCDEQGQFVYIRDRQTGKFWSAGYQPTRREPKSFEVIYAIDKAEFRRIDDEIETVMEVVVAPDRDLEVRRVTLANLGQRPRSLDLTSYAEIVLDTQAADVAHPAFGKLFLETEWLANSSALLVRRRPRSPQAPAPWAFHATIGPDATGEVSWDSDRVQILGRRRTTAEPAMLDSHCANLGGTTGAVLDPALALRRHVTVEPGERATVSFVTGAAMTREAILKLLESVSTPAAVDHVFELAWAQSRIELQHNHLKTEDIHLFQRLAGHLLYPVGPLRAPQQILATNRESQSGLWRFGISGDWPITLVRLNGPDGLPLLRHLLLAHHYWTSHGLKADLVVLLANAGGYFDELHNQTTGLVRSLVPADRLDRPGGVFVRKGWQMNEADRVLLLTVARVVLDDRSGPLESQADRLGTPQSMPPRLVRKSGTPARPEPRIEPTPRHCPNGFGEFIADGREYLIAPAQPGAVPPLPWANVIANPAAGFIITDSGGGYVWAENSQTNRLTPWSNDPCLDPPGDCFFVQDLDTLDAWSPTPLPCAIAPVEVRHGAGYTVFQSHQAGLQHELTVFVPVADAVKVSRLKLRNTGTRIRRVAVFYYAELVLGSTRSATAQHIVTELDADSGVVLARNPFHPMESQRVAFVDCDVRPRTVTGDRAEFLGRNGRLATPAALERVALSGRVGAGYDPCVAIRGTLILAPGEEQTIVGQIGQVGDVRDVRRTVAAHRGAEAEKAREAVANRWRHFSDTIRIQTPDAAFNSLMNQWLPYQVLSCRLWGRSAVYQSGGAYGFRDQLQDVCALVHAAPGLVRDQILRAAARQFTEGDVQHWWHEPGGAGVRTRISDDFLWLPYTVEYYATTTGDREIWDRSVPFLSGRALEPQEHEIFETPNVSEESGSIYEHCVRALKRGWALGPHGLPLIGTGDWNDGMNEIGSHGRGESIWLAWFQIVVLTRFMPIAESRGDAEFAEKCRQHAEQLRVAVEQHGWDGRWYRRAYFDDGSPVGSAANEECRIDSLAQTWAVLSRVADRDRATQAMDEVMRQLVQPEDRLVLLFTPPFDAGPQQPGYIKGYVPGVRENGGQYTHAAAWVIQALAELGRGDEAFKTFNLLNPASITATGDGVSRYKGEPYVVAGDVYSLTSHRGRVGWTWYTGSAGWLYRIGLENIIGLRRSNDVLEIRPCLPSAWDRVEITYRFVDTEYAIVVTNPQRSSPGVVNEVYLDGALQSDHRVKLQNDKGKHTMEVRLQ
ncbi:GH36-type glycosyl hydrolase domain-containing protein [Limnoglobus roseus]|uniref:GH36-type glycosyl hydrolase domain-containing protein n=1 Tax=Limnoglobus roseus TaxID=2598579 RepID=UPI00143DB9DA|nr:glucoamylase family protein [Limnoglobus roseus]